MPALLGVALLQMLVVRAMLEERRRVELQTGRWTLRRAELACVEGVFEQSCVFKPEVEGVAPRGGLRRIVQPSAHAS